MLPFFISPYFYYGIGILQIVCIIHALRTGRREWLYLLIFIPAIGAIIYIIQEIAPSLRTANIATDVQHTFVPNSRIRELERKLEVSDTEANRMNLAAEYARQKQYPKAIELVKSCLAGIYANDPGMMLELAKLYFNNKQTAESLVYFEKVRQQKDVRLEKGDDELLYARALDEHGSVEKAEEVYQKVIRVDHSLQARYFYGLLLKRLGRNDEAKEQFRAIQKEKDLHPAFVRRRNAEWVRRSRKELTGL
jgi:hypothetical protein